MLFLPPEARVRYEVYTNYPALGGVLAYVIPREDVTQRSLPEGVDWTQPATFTARATAETIAAALARRPLRVVEFHADGTFKRASWWRFMKDTLAVASGSRTLA